MQNLLKSYFLYLTVITALSCKTSDESSESGLNSPYRTTSQTVDMAVPSAQFTRYFDHCEFKNPTDNSTYWVFTSINDLKEGKNGYLATNIGQARFPVIDVKRNIAWKQKKTINIAQIMAGNTVYYTPRANLVCYECVFTSEEKFLTSRLGEWKSDPLGAERQLDKERKDRLTKIRKNREQMKNFVAECYKPALDRSRQSCGFFPTMGEYLGGPQGFLKAPSCPVP